MDDALPLYKSPTTDNNKRVQRDSLGGMLAWPVHILPDMFYPFLTYTHTAILLI